MYTNNMVYIRFELSATKIRTWDPDRGQFVTSDKLNRKALGPYVQFSLIQINYISYSHSIKDIFRKVKYEQSFGLYISH